MPTGVYIRTDEHKLKISQAAKNSGVGLWMRGREGRKHTQEAINKIKEARLNQKPPTLGMKFSEEHRANLSLSQKGEKGNNWRGGLSKESRLIRTSGIYKRWRKTVLERDGHVCTICGSQENLEVDHIKRFADYPELRFEVSNGRVLCHKHHVETDTYGSKKQ